MIRRLALGAAAAALLVIPSPVLAQVDGACTFQVNGVEIDRIDSLNSPLELDTEDTLIVSGTDPAGTRSAVVRLIIGPVPVESGTSTYATPTEDFQASLSIDDVSPYGVGLFRVEAETDGCTAQAWVRVSGRLPFATLTGLTAIGLTIGGITGQLGAVSSRRRWARSAAALGGLATGTGAALLGQQFGRLQLSYVSLAIVIAVAAALGWMMASLLNPTVREQRREARRQPAPRQRREPEPVVTKEPAESDPPIAPAEPAETPEPTPAPSPTPEPTTTESPAAASTATAPPAPEPAPTDGPYWCYVLAPTEVFDLTDHTKSVAGLEPGTWYLVKRTVSGWAHVVAGEGSEGWVAASAVHRQG